MGRKKVQNTCKKLSK